MISTMPMRMRRSHADSLQECRTEALYRECRNDRDKTAQLRGMGTALANLTFLVNELDNEAPFPDVPAQSHDNGIPYRSPRYRDPGGTATDMVVRHTACLKKETRDAVIQGSQSARLDSYS